jgi:3-oxoacyl-[acyl-carrier protein] reductase
MALIRCGAIKVVSPSIARHKFSGQTTSAELLDRLPADEAFGRAAEP